MSSGSALRAASIIPSAFFGRYFVSRPSFFRKT